jgi:hypothetical protein
VKGLQGVFEGKQTVGVGGLVEVCRLVEKVLYQGNEKTKIDLIGSTSQFIHYAHQCYQ